MAQSTFDKTDTSETHAHPIYSNVPLDYDRREIRLLQVLPGHEDAPIQSKLSKVSLDENPEFNVLSYAWNSQCDQKPILIQEQEFLVSTHLYQCLVNLRLESEELTIWIDAICIDQSSMHEKNTQVPLMRDIYQSAAQTYVWLGELTPGLEIALDSMQNLLQRDGEFKLEAFEQLMEGFNTSPETFFAAISELLHLGWFRRTWIIQEVALPRRDPLFVCGHKRIQWTDFVRWKRKTSDFNDNIIDHSHLAAHDPAWRELHAMIDFRPFGALMSMRDIVQNSSRAENGMELSSLLFFSQESLATDPRDKVYGVMGLADANARTNITIGYSKGVEDLYEEVTRYLIFTEGKLNHIAQPHRNLTLAQLHGKSAEAKEDHDIKASWIRDFRFRPPPKNSESPLIPDWCGRTRMYDAVLRSGTVEAGDRLPRQLRIVGMKLDIVKECVVAWYQLPGRIQTFKNWAGILPVYFRALGKDDFDYTQPDEYPWDSMYSPRAKSLKPIKEAIWRTATADKMLDGVTRPPNWYGLFLKGYVEAYIGTQSTNIVIEGDEVPPNMEASEAVNELHRFQQRLGLMMVGRSAFRTHDGWIGMGPDNIKEGDVIALMSGGDAPLVLRPCQNHYHVIGNCYVEGVMYGEIPKGYKEGATGEGAASIPGEVFVIR